MPLHEKYDKSISSTSKKIAPSSRDVNITFACILEGGVHRSFFSTREQIQGRKARHVPEALLSFFASGLRSESLRLLHLTLAGSDL